MIVSELDPSKIYQPLTQQRFETADVKRPQDTTFADSLKSFIGDVDLQQKESNDMTEKMIKGDPVDLHDVMISAEKAKTTFTLLLEMRNKFLDLYKETSRMQV
jgi:flagellar hook-basal body complex protein FliE